MGSLLIITGPPGAGKSTVARLLAERVSPSVLVEGDAFFAFLAAGATDPWFTEADEQNRTVATAAGSATAAFVRGGYQTFYDGIVGPWHLDVFAAGLGLDSFDYAVLLPPVEECVARVASRRGHGFTDEAAARHMHAQFATRRGDPRHLLTDLPDRAEDVADRIVSERSTRRLRVER